MSTLAEHLKELQEIAADPKHGKASRWFEVAAYTMVNAHLSELVALAMHKQQDVTPDVVERVARAIYEQRPRLIHSQMSAERGAGEVPWVHAPQRWKRVAYKQARAAIAALLPIAREEKQDG